MVVADDDRRYVAANPAACLLLRLPEAEVLTRRIDDLTPGGDQAEMDTLWRAFLTEGTQRGTFELLMPDGPRLRVEYSATANIEPGRHLSILLFPPGEMEVEPVRTTPTERVLTDREREVLGMIAMGMGSTSASTLELSRR
jgi:PAS domain-containing protein